MATRAILSLMLVFAVCMAANAQTNASGPNPNCEPKLNGILALVQNNDLPTIEAALSYIPKDMNDCVTFISARCPEHNALINTICTAYFNKKNA